MTWPPWLTTLTIKSHEYPSDSCWHILANLCGSLRFLGEGNGNPLQYSCLENPLGRGVWQATVHGVARVGHDLATKPNLGLLGLSSAVGLCCSYMGYAATWSWPEKRWGQILRGVSCCLQRQTPLLCLLTWGMGWAGVLFLNKEWAIVQVLRVQRGLG